MTTATIGKAFAVWFENLERWDPQSFHKIVWDWPLDLLQPIKSFLKIRKEKVNRIKNKFTDLQPITIHFDGSIDKRLVDENKEYRMDLFHAYPGDIIVAKIDLKNGAVAIVPEDWVNVVVTSHFAVYKPDLSKIVPQYFHCLIQTPFFKNYLWRNKVGAEGRKEVKLDFFENIKIPRPTLPVQQKIVDYWQKGQTFLSDLNKQLENLRNEAEIFLAETLGVSINFDESKQKNFGIMWDRLSRWDIIFAKSNENMFTSKKYPTKKLRELVLPLKETNQRLTPANFPENEFNYLGMENVESETGRIVNFNPVLGKQIKSSSVIFDEEHILYGKLRPYLRKIVIPSLHGISRGIASSEFIAIKSKEGINKFYLAEYLRSAIIAKQAEMAIGARMPRISTQMFLNLKIPLPSEDVQLKIIKELNAYHTKAESMISKISNTKSTIQQTIESVILGHKRIGEVL
jgi:restriction endonuclease S subunit